MIDRVPVCDRLVFAPARAAAARAVGSLPTAVAFREKEEVVNNRCSRHKARAASAGGLRHAT